MRVLKQSTAATVLVLMVDSADHVTGKTGLTLTVTASKNGGAFASISPTVTERSDGWYSLALTTAHTDTIGDLALHVAATGADPSDRLLVVESATTSDLATTEAAIKAKTDNLPASPAAVSDIPAAATVATAVWANGTRTLSAFGFSVTASSVSDKTGYSLAASQTFNVTGNITGNLSGSVGSVTGAVGSVTGNVGGSVASVTGNVGGSVASVTAGVTLATSQPNYAPAKAGDAMTLTAAYDAAKTAASQTSVTTLTGYVDTEVATILAAVDTEVAAIKAKTDNLPASPAATGDIPTASAIAGQVWNETAAAHVTAGSFGYYLKRLFGWLFWKKEVTTAQIKYYDSDSTTLLGTQTISGDGSTNSAVSKEA